MIVKQRDAQPDILQALEWRGRQSGDEIHRTACRSAIARLKADPTVAEACDAIDRDFGDSIDWAVLHDLRLTVDGHSIQINHVLINRDFDCILIDSRYRNHGLCFGPNGACDAITRGQSFPVASPLVKLARDVRVFETLLGERGMLPRRFGRAVRSSVRGVVLTHPSERLVKPASTRSHKTDVQAADALFASLWGQGGHVATARHSQASPTQLQALAGHLAERHQPVYAASLLSRGTALRAETAALIATGT